MTIDLEALLKRESAHVEWKGEQFWVLRDSHTIEAKGALLKELLRKKKEEPPFLERPCSTASLDDINRTAAEEFLGELRLRGTPADYLKPGVTIDALSHPLVIAEATAPDEKKPVPTYLALLLFGREPSRFVPGARAVLSIYEGDTKAATSAIRVDVTGPLPKLIRDILEKLALHNGTSIDKSADALAIRQNRPRYSSKAVQEAVVNAFAHRDYESGEPTRITVFSDRIEVENPGGLDADADPALLTSGRAPVRWRNRALASFLLRMELAQNEGQGIPTIQKETFEVSGRPPDFHLTKTSFQVVIPAFQPTPPPQRVTVASPRSAVEGLVLISIGGESLLPFVEASRKELGLEDVAVLVDLAIPEYVEPDAKHWEENARRLRKVVKSCVDNPAVSRLHLFYRGPVVMAPLLGALVAPAKPLVVYHYEGGRYRQAYVLDRRFLITRD